MIQSLLNEVSTNWVRGTYPSADRVNYIISWPSGVDSQYKCNSALPWACQEATVTEQRGCDARIRLSQCLNILCCLSAKDFTYFPSWLCLVMWTRYVNETAFIIKTPNRRLYSRNRIKMAKFQASEDCKFKVSYTLSLEDLHFDARHHILLAIDTIVDLSTLIRASPTFFQQYRLNREFWLSYCLELELGSLVIDAHTVHLSINSKFRSERTEEQTKDFTKAYHVQRSSSLWTRLDLQENEDIVPVIAFYSTIIKPLVSHYVRWTQGNHRYLSTAGQLSKTEKRRIVRGFYRFQLLSNLFGSNGMTGRLCSGHEQRLGHFLDMFEPWELEEIICIYWFINGKYLSVLEEVAWDFNEDNPRFDSRKMDPYMPEGAYHLEIFGMSWLPHPD